MRLGEYQKPGYVYDAGYADVNKKEKLLELQGVLF